MVKYCLKIPLRINEITVNNSEVNSRIKKGFFNKNTLVLMKIYLEEFHRIKSLYLDNGIRDVKITLSDPGAGIREFQSETKQLVLIRIYYLEELEVSMK